MLNFPEKLPNAEAYAYIRNNNLFLELKIEGISFDKEIFNFHELAMLWKWEDDQLIRYFSTRKVIEGIMK